MTPTKENFLAAVSTEVKARYPWAKDDARLADFQRKLRDTMNTDRNAVSIDGDAFKAAWKTIGAKGKLTFKALRALPAGDQ